MKGFRHYWSTCQGLETLGVSAETYKTFLSSVLINRLLSKLHLIICRRVSNNEWGLSVILKEFLLELEARVRSLNNGAAPTFQQMMREVTMAATLLRHPKYSVLLLYTSSFTRQLSSCEEYWGPQTVTQEVRTLLHLSAEGPHWTAVLVSFAAQYAIKNITNQSVLSHTGVIFYPDKQPSP